MIFAIPVGTDAPIYHVPFTTVGLIVVNVVCFAATGFGHEESTLPWILEWGHINPIEWVTTMFAHASFGHLISNMIFLWSFGVVVEGKIGWYKMLGLYMLIGMAQAALVQVIMLPWEEGGALGASSAIMGLMAINMVWAPKNELRIFYFFWIFIFVRTGIYEITLMWFAFFYLAFECLLWTLSVMVFDSGMNTQALHLSGALFGLAVGILMLKKGWVDCENWDLFRVMSGNYGRYADSNTTVGSHADPRIMFGKKDVSIKDDLPDESHKAKSSKLFDRINRLIDSGDFITASEKMFDLRMKDSASQLTEKRLKKMAVGLLKCGMPEDGEIYVEEYIERFPDDCAWARLRMGQLLLTHHRQPRAALQMLKKVRLSQLGPEQQSQAKKIAAAAKNLVREGVEDAEHEW